VLSPHAEEMIVGRPRPREVKVEVPAGLERERDVLGSLKILDAIWQAELIAHLRYMVARAIVKVGIDQ